MLLQPVSKPRTVFTVKIYTTYCTLCSLLHSNQQWNQTRNIFHPLRIRAGLVWFSASKTERDAERSNTHVQENNDIYNELIKNPASQTD